MHSTSPPLRPHALAPTDARSCVQGVDIARGIALLGIILVNARLFFLPFMWAAEPRMIPSDMQASTVDLDGAGIWELYKWHHSAEFELADLRQALNSPCARNMAIPRAP